VRTSIGAPLVRYIIIKTSGEKEDQKDGWLSDYPRSWGGRKAVMILGKERREKRGLDSNGSEEEMQEVTKFRQGKVLLSCGG